MGIRTAYTRRRADKLVKAIRSNRADRKAAGVARMERNPNAPRLEGMATDRTKLTNAKASSFVQRQIKKLK